MQRFLERNKEGRERRKGQEQKRNGGKKKKKKRWDIEEGKTGDEEREKEK